MSQRSPFTSEKVHTPASASQAKPDGGLMKRVQSQPSLMNQAAFPNLSGQAATVPLQPTLGRTSSHPRSLTDNANASPTYAASGGSRLQPGGTGSESSSLTYE